MVGRTRPTPASLAHLVNCGLLGPVVALIVRVFAVVGGAAVARGSSAWRGRCTPWWRALDRSKAVRAVGGEGGQGRLELGSGASHGM